MIMKISQRFGKETFVNFYQKTTILIFTISFFAYLYAWFLSTPEGLDLYLDPPNLLLSTYPGGGVKCLGRQFDHSPPPITKVLRLSEATTYFPCTPPWGAQELLNQI